MLPNWQVLNVGNVVGIGHPNAERALAFSTDIEEVRSAKDGGSPVVRSVGNDRLPFVTRSLKV